jgi:hypothetical protein
MTKNQDIWEFAQAFSLINIISAKMPYDVHYVKGVPVYISAICSVCKKESPRCDLTPLHEGGLEMPGFAIRGNALMKDELVGWYLEDKLVLCPDHVAKHKASNG